MVVYLRIDKTEARIAVDEAPRLRISVESTKSFCVVQRRFREKLLPFMAGAHFRPCSLNRCRIQIWTATTQMGPWSVEHMRTRHWPPVRSPAEIWRTHLQGLLAHSPTVEHSVAHNPLRHKAASVTRKRRIPHPALRQMSAGNA